MVLRQRSCQRKELRSPQRLDPGSAGRAGRYLRRRSGKENLASGRKARRRGRPVGSSDVGRDGWPSPVAAEGESTGKAKRNRSRRASNKGFLSMQLDDYLARLTIVSRNFFMRIEESASPVRAAWTETAGRACIWMSEIFRRGNATIRVDLRAFLAVQPLRSS